MPIDIATLALAGIKSFIVCGLLALLPSQRPGSVNMAQDLFARQALHKRPTPRIGGAAILLSFGLCLGLHHERLGADILAALAAGLIVLFVGLREDIWRDVSPRIRLLAALASGALAVATSGVLVPGLGLPQSDYLFSFGAVALAVTLLWSAGTCHALNLIDGLNGLAGGYAICAATAFYLIAGMSGAADLQMVALVLIAAIGGFLLLNWPFGRIFLGDAGAYAIGHVLAWLGILLMARNPEISGFAILLVLFWPVGETTYSIIRRRLARKATDQPDRLHAHHVMVRGLGQLLGPAFPALYRNSLASLLLLPFAIAPMVTGVLLSTSPAAAAAALAGFTALYIATYHLALAALRSRRLRRRGPRALPPPPAGPLPKGTLSPLSGSYRAAADRLEVAIYRPDGETAWCVQVKDRQGKRRRWWTRYANDRAAQAAVSRYLAANDDTGMADENRA